jgi:hypothetical protein
MTYKQSGMDHDLEVMLLDGKDETVPSHIVYKERIVSMKAEPKTHSRENHDFYISMKRKCPYCLQGIPIKEEEL